MYLNMKVSSAISFHPDTFKNTPELTHLYLGTCSSSTALFIPPLENFVRNDADDDDDFDGTLTTLAAPN